MYTWEAKHILENSYLIVGGHIAVCKFLVDCGSLDNPLNGQVELTSGRSVANYMCDRRYVLCGMDSRICQSNGSWSGSPPQCISKQ